MPPEEITALVVALAAMVKAAIRAAGTVNLGQAVTSLYRLM